MFRINSLLRYIMDRRIKTPAQKMMNNVRRNAMKTAEYVASTDTNHINADDKMYLNIVIPYAPNDSGLSPAFFQQQFTVPVLNIPDDYYLSIVRFSIPCQDIPIINFANYIQPFPNTDPDLTIFSVTLEYNGDIVQRFVEFATETPFLQAGTLSANNPKVSYNNPYYFTYSYSNILMMFNAALSDAYSGLAAPPLVSSAPFFIFDETTYKIGLVAENAYLDSATPPINVYVNFAAFSTFFSGIPSSLLGYKTANGMDVQFLIRDQFNNYLDPAGNVFVNPSGSHTTFAGGPVMYQEYPTLINMNSFRNLTLQSNMLSITQEFSVSSTSANNLSIINGVPILTDFIPLDAVGFESRGNVTYTPTGPYHLINLKGKNPITNLDIGIYWTDQFGQIYPLYIPYNQNATIKFAFIRKDTFTS